jgi:tRNA-dihydrouridine synthase
VTVKTRIGYNRESIDEWIPALLEMNLPALTVHLRTRKEMSKVAAHWDRMPRIIELRNKINPNTLIIGNGDIKNLDDAREKLEASGADGAMLGRGIFGNPWLFSERTSDDITFEERLAALVTLAQYFDEIIPLKAFHIFRKHIKAFVSGFDNAAELRASLMKCENSIEILEVATEALH